jgi:trehalose-6-phosphate synthase
MPPKDYRKKIRAIFDHAYKEPLNYSERIDELRGYVSYLNAFDAMRDSHHLSKYKMILKKISAVSRSSMNGGAENAASGEVL